MLEYNLDADIEIIVLDESYYFSIVFGSGDGCTKKDCERVSLYVEELCNNEEVIVYRELEEIKPIDSDLDREGLLR